MNRDSNNRRPRSDAAETPAEVPRPAIVRRFRSEPVVQIRMPKSNAPGTFELCKLNLEDRGETGAAGEEVRTVIAGYHWFTDWGRDTMSRGPARRSLPHCGCHALVFCALDRYLQYTGDHETLQTLLPVPVGIYEVHLRGTAFGIGVDPEDGLLRQGADGYQFTWMDARVGD